METDDKRGIQEMTLMNAEELNHRLTICYLGHSTKLSFLRALKSLLSYLRSLPKKLALIYHLYRAL